MNIAQLDKFIEELAGRYSSNTVQNMYYGDDTAATIRRQNLRLYLNAMEDSKVLLVGEAPGYRGCGETGIPFTSEYIMWHSLAFGPEQGYRLAVSKDKPMREATATIVWDTLNRVRSLPLMWNAFPWHPHDKGNVLSNRTPSVDELQEGARVLQCLIDLYPIELVIAVGRKAEGTLKKFNTTPEWPSITNNVRFEAVRHPSNGGKPDFVSGVTKLLA